MKRFFDSLAPKGESLQIILKKKGVPVSGVYVDDKQEVRSESLDSKDRNADARSNQ